MGAIVIRARHFDDVADALPCADQQMKGDIQVLVANGEEIVLHLFRPRQMFLLDLVGYLDLAAVHRVDAVSTVEILKAARELPQVR
jgi:hypothetical protein